MPKCVTAMKLDWKKRICWAIFAQKEQQPQEEYQQYIIVLAYCQ